MRLNVAHLEVVDPVEMIVHPVHSEPVTGAHL